MTVEQAEGRGAIGAREHNGGAQDQRRGKETQVHRETPKTNGNGRETHAYASCRAEPSRSTGPTQDGAAVERDVGSPLGHDDVTFGTSSERIVYPSSPALLIGEVCQRAAGKEGRWCGWCWLYWVLPGFTANLERTACPDIIA
jgi:hypothetical protein